MNQYQQTQIRFAPTRITPVRVVAILLACLLLTGCVAPRRPIPPIAATVSVPAETVTYTDLRSDPAVCTGTFIPQDLDHTTTTVDGEIRSFESNGAGVAVGDLDGDGDLDLVLGSHAGPDTILWNQGGLTFRKQSFGPGKTRSVVIVDVDGDGWLDIVLTRHTGAISYWRNQGQDVPSGQRFVQEFLPGISSPAYVQDWADLDLDGDLDLVTASYDAALLNDLGSNFILGNGGGVYVYAQTDGIFHASALAQSAQALAISLLDVTGDGRLDILVGNDFAVPDMAWAWSPDGWSPVTPFAHTTHSTMSFDAGDVDNNGQMDLFATDMKPPDQSAETMAAWQPLMEGMPMTHDANDPQRMENTLQVQTEPGRFEVRGDHRPIDATGWSWSGKFGDLDNDGYLDLYIVNGMIEKTIFAHLPDYELVEPNRVFRNDGQGGFEPVTTWGLNSMRSGRGMVMADLDDDGDLDIVVNNLRAPAQLFENRLCAGGGVEVDLRWPNSHNTHAIGAAVTLHTDQGDLLRQVRVASGYISADSSRLHFGVPAEASIRGLTVRWPDGETSQVSQVKSGQRVTVSRVSSGR